MDFTATMDILTPDAPLGVPGYTFADLYEPDRLASLYERFCEQIQADHPALWSDWDDYRRSPDAPRPPVALSNLLTAMAPHVSRFIARLFRVEADTVALSAATRAQDDLFRFKIDFVSPSERHGQKFVDHPMLL